MDVVYPSSSSEEEGKLQLSMDKSEVSDREERLQMFMGTFTSEDIAKFKRPDNIEPVFGCYPMTFTDFCNYELDRMESDGFDIGDYPRFSNFGVITRLHYPPDKPAPHEMLIDLKYSSRLAIQQFNKAQKTKFRNVVVLKANVQPLSPYRYYITFKASDKNNNSQVFQARVNVGIPTTEKIVELVRRWTAPKLFHITSPSKTSPAGDDRDQ